MGGHLIIKISFMSRKPVRDRSSSLEVKLPASDETQRYFSTALLQHATTAQFKMKVNAFHWRHLVGIGVIIVLMRLN